MASLSISSWHLSISPPNGRMTVLLMWALSISCWCSCCCCFFLADVISWLHIFLQKKKKERKRKYNLLSVNESKWTVTSLTTVTVWRSPIIAMKECTCPSLTRKCTLTSGAWQFHNRSGTSVIAKEAFPTLSLLFTVGAANRIIFFLSLWCLTLPVTKKKKLVQIEKMCRRPHSCSLVLSRQMWN